MYFKNEGLSNNKNDIPSTSEHFSFLLESRWKDGDSLKIGSTGLDGDRSIPYVFPGKSLQNFNEWSEEKVGNTPGDRHGLLIGELLDWKDEDYRSLEVALLYQRSFDSIFNALVQHENLKKVYDFNQFTNSVEYITTTHKPLKNPMIKGEWVKIEQAAVEAAHFYDISGKLIKKVNVENSRFLVPSHINSGIYLVQLKGSDHNIISYKSQVTE